MLVFAPTTSSTPTNFHVFTDVELAHPTCICSYKASYTLAYTPLTVATTVNPLNTLLTGTSIVTPADYGNHPVTIKIVSSNYAATVLPVSFNYNVVVSCQITSFTLTTAATNFNYILNSGNVITGPYTTTQVNACGYPVTYSV